MLHKLAEHHVKTFKIPKRCPYYLDMQYLVYLFSSTNRFKLRIQNEIPQHLFDRLVSNFLKLFEGPGEESVRTLLIH